MDEYIEENGWVKINERYNLSTNTSSENYMQMKRSRNLYFLLFL